MANKLSCSTEGCKAVLITSEALSPNATYSCSRHTKRNEDKTRFQKHQFDRDLSRAGTPQGTTHIANQGSRPKPKGERPSYALKPEADEDA
jgi:hypothetical protein